MKSSNTRSGTMGVIAGFPKVEAADAPLEDCIGRIDHEPTGECFLDWALKDWPVRYAKERQLLRIFHCGRTCQIPQAMVFDNTSRNMRNSDIFVSRVAESFVLDPAIKAATEDAFARYLENLKRNGKDCRFDDNVRLVGLEMVAGQLELKVQDVNYESYIRTNLVLDYAQDRHHPTLRSLIHGGRRLEPMADSPLANNLGINVLIFTLDGQMIVQMRSNAVMVRPGEYCPSASGTVASADIPMRRTPLQEIPLMREAVEELGHGCASKEDIFLLGITRELIRGGEPEIFLAARSHLSASDVQRSHQTASDRSESDGLRFFGFSRYAFEETLDTEEKRLEFNSLVDSFIVQFKDRMSIPLWTAVALWKEARLRHLKMFAD